MREEDKKRVKVEKSTRVYKFGGGETRNSICVVQLPCHLARTNVLVDMVETKSGHFSIPISRPKQGDRYAEEIQCLVCETKWLSYKEVEKLHHYFGHVSVLRLEQLIPIYE